jgi:HSP20 family protein
MLTRRIWARPSFNPFDNPFQDFEQLRRGMLRLLDSARDNPEAEASAGLFPPVNVSQDDNNFYVRAVVPGVKASDISISALRNRVTISGKREIPAEIDDKVSYHRRERAEEAFSRVITLPTEIAADRVDARSADGVLTLTVPKAEETKPRQIVVKS